MASQQLATIADLEALSLPAAAYSDATDDVKNRALVAASSLAASYLKKRFAFPLVQWGDDLKLCVACIAAYFLMKRRGFNPQAGADAIIVTGYRDQVGEPGKPGWLDRVSRGDCEPDDIIDSTPEVEEASPLVATSAPAFDSGSLFGVSTDADDPCGCRWP